MGVRRLVPSSLAAPELKKSGAFTDEDRDADLGRSYFAGGELRLPPGALRIDVTTAGVIGEQCRGERLALEISLLVTVIRVAEEALGSVYSRL